MENNMKIIHELSSNLDRLKKFDTGYTSRNNNALLVSYNGIVYKLSIEKIGEAEITMDLIDEVL